MTDTELISRIALSLLPGMDREKAIAVLSLTGSVEELFEMPECQLKALFPGRNEFVGTQVRFKAMETAREELDFVRRHNIGVHYFADNSYPSKLADCRRAPVIVYTLGNCDLNSAVTVSVVGTRQCTSYGADFTEELVAGLASRVDNVVIISGLAYGVDICAHRAALKHGIPTVAVVAHGLSTIYPAVHRETASRMVHGNGMLLSDYHHSAPVHRSNFLSRNRLVAALSDAVVVVESGVHGGALATANLASQSGRRVFALPGRVSDSRSEGCNELIAKGTATLLTSVDALIAGMGWKDRGKAAAATSSLPDDITPDELEVMRHLAANPSHDTEQIADALGKPIGTMMSILIGMELRDLVSPLPNSHYRLSKTIDTGLLL